MKRPHIAIIGGGLSGLSAGCYALASGFETTILEHSAALGGVCTAWSRGPYTLDGCLHWLTGGPFDRVYRELGIYPQLSVHTLETFAQYVEPNAGVRISITRDLDALGRDLHALAPEDGEEIQRLLRASREFADMHAPLDALELSGMGEALHQFWDMRHQLTTIAHFRKPVRAWASEHLRSPQLRRLLSLLVPPDAPALFLLMILGYLARGYLSRPDGGSGRFRDALIASYERAGGRVQTAATVEEILVDADRACGVRLANGTLLRADVVISTASAPETVLRLLGGQYGAAELRERLQKWKLFDPIVLASYAVSKSLSDLPTTLLIDGLRPFEVGGRDNQHLYVRTYNDDPSFAPEGHTVVQVMAATNYDWWALPGIDYAAAKRDVAGTLQLQLEEQVPVVRGAIEAIDVATPLTFWNRARSWRGSYEGWMPSSEGFFGHIRKKLPNLQGFYMAGQWVEPGGGVPTAVLSGRQVTQLVCADRGHAFAPPVPPEAPPEA